MSAATIASRKHRELEVKLGSLEDELGGWETLAAPGGPMEKHHSQIARLAAQMRALQREVALELAAANDQGAVLARAVDIERTILQVHRVWDFFRRKLALRRVEHVRPWLAAADELAWACYEPALRRRRKQGDVDPKALREPPLVYLDDDIDFASPVEYSRQKAFDAAALPKVPRAAFLSILQSLPVPLVGVPWYQLAHLPEMALIAHEVGHIVEDDLALTKRLHALADTALRKASVPEGRRVAWDAWLGEIFADIWGVLALGPAFAWTLQTFIAEAPASVAAQQRPTASGWGAYPTTTLRALLAAATVERIGHAATAKGLRLGWSAEFPVHAMKAYEDDVHIIVASIVEGPWPELGGGALTETLSFDAKRQKTALAVADYLVDHNAVEDGKPLDVRALIAAAGLAVIDDPRTFAERDRADALVNAIEQSITAGVRDESGAVDPAIEAAHAATTAAWDDAAGGRLLALLKGA